MALRLGTETLVGARVTLRPVRPADAESLPFPKSELRADGRDRDLGRAARFTALVEDAVAGLVMLHTIGDDAAQCGVYVVPGSAGAGSRRRRCGC